MTAGLPRAVVLYNAPVLPAGHPGAASELDVVAVAGAIAACLSDHGFDAVELAAGPSLVSLIGELERLEPDVVFNLVESFAGSDRGAAYLTGLLELLRVAYTGCAVEPLALCLSKSRAKALLRGCGLPSAPGVLVPPGATVSPWDWAGPAIVKPDAEDGSLGIDQGSVVADAAAASLRVAYIHDVCRGPALVEQYLTGAEFNVGVLALPEPQALPIAAVEYRADVEGWPILTYEAKWAPESPEYSASRIVCPAPIDGHLAGRIAGLAVAAFRAAGCRDYARVDLRLDREGNPMILEVNPNPDLGPQAGWARALRSSGRDYGATIAALAHQAMTRVRAAPLVDMRPGGPARCEA